MKKLLITFCTLGLAGLILLGCQIEPCFFPKEPRLLLLIYRTPDTLVTNIEIDKIYAENTSDTIVPVFIKGGLLLPLRQNSDNTAFKIKLKNFPDTFKVAVSYTTKVSLASSECGYVTLFEQLKPLSHNFDTLFTDRSFIDTSYAVNMRSYLQY